MEGLSAILQTASRGYLMNEGVKMNLWFVTVKGEETTVKQGQNPD